MTQASNSHGDNSADEQQEIHLAFRAGTRSVLLAHIGSQFVSLASLAFLYRLISESDFGLWGMLMPVIMVLRMLASIPLIVAAVQQRDLSSGKASSLFWFGLLFSSLAGLAAVACGPLLSLAYDADELIVLAAALGLTPLLTALGAQHQAMLERKLRLGRLASSRLLAQTLAALAGIAAAVAGWGVWALVLQQYVELTALTIMLWCVETWRPSSPRGGEPVRELLRFGGFHGLSGLLVLFAQNIDKVMLAFLLRDTAAGRAVVGMYTQAFNLAMRPPLALIGPLKAVLLPALSRARPYRDTYGELLCNAYRMIAVIMVPCGVGLFVVAEDVMQVMAPDWTGAGLILRGLALSIAVQGFFEISGHVFSSVGRADLWFAGSLATTLVLLQGYGFGYWLGDIYGPTALGPALGMAYGYTVVSIVVLFLPYLYYVSRPAGIPLIAILRELRWAIVASASMGLVVWWLRGVLETQSPLPAAARLTIAIVVGILVYLVFAWREVRWLAGEIGIWPRG